MTHGQQSMLGEDPRAIVSCDGLYRYALHRTWDRARPVALFIMLNPSTADHEQDDPTIRKCIGFAQRFGCGRLQVANLYAYRTKDPAVLCSAQRAGIDIVGPETDNYLRILLADEAAAGRYVIAAWGQTTGAGRPTGIVTRVAQVRELAAEVKAEFACISTTSKGDPRHPLMAPYVGCLERWPNG